MGRINIEIVRKVKDIKDEIKKAREEKIDIKEIEIIECDENNMKII